MQLNQSISFFGIFWPAFSSFVAALILFGIGLWINRWRQKRKQEELYVSILRSIHYDYRKNLDLLCQLHAYLFVRILPSFKLELSRKDELLKTLIPICLNFNLLDRISEGYFELVHIQRRLDQVIQSYGSSEFESLLRGTHTLMNIRIQFIFEILSEIIDEIREKGGNGIVQLPEDYLEKKFEEFQKDPEILSAAKAQGIDLSRRNRFYLNFPMLKTQASGSANP